MTNVKVDRKDVISDRELESTLKEADKLPKMFFILRAKALVSILGRTGKRRAEVARLEREDVKIKGDNLSLTFVLVKKRKKSVITRRREKQIPVTDPLAQCIIQHWEWMKKNHPECRYLFPQTRSVFGKTLAFYNDRHISGRHVLRIIKQLNPNAWCHLFRETVGAEVVKNDPTLIGVFKVMMRLDLEKETTAWNYMRRYAVDLIRQGKA